MHFNAYFADRPPYTTEAIRLKKVLQNGWPLVLATLYGTCTQTLPFWIAERIKDTFRSMYHALFGPRAVKPSNRA